MQGLEEAKVGDIVMFGESYDKRIAKIERITATQVVIEGGTKFSKRDGKRVGSTGWDSTWAKIANAEDIDAVSKKMRIRELNNWVQRVQVTQESLHLFETLYIDINKLKLKEQK